MQFDLVTEPRRLLHAEALRVPTSFALCTASGTGAKNKNFTQRFVEMDQLDVALNELPELPGFGNTHAWISQNTLRGGARNRRISSVVLLNAIWVDLDVRHPPPEFTAAGLKAPHGGTDSFSEDEAHHCTELLLMDLENAQLPPPTCVIGTGGGLCAKWIFDQPVPSSARARWTSLQRHLVDRVAAIRGDFSGLGIDGSWAWPVDTKVCDAARILRVVGTVNPRWGATCRMLWDAGPEHDFNVLADSVLPYTQEEVKEWRARAATWKGWDRNRAKATAAGFVHAVRAKAPGAQGAHGDHDHMLEDEAVRSLWTSRFELGRAWLAARGGPGVGERNSTWWPMATALAWSCGGEEHDLLRSLAALHQDLYLGKGWTWAEALASAGNVIGKMRAGEGYKFTSGKWLEKMGISPAEAGRLQPDQLVSVSGHNANRAGWAVGAMNFERLKGLEYGRWEKEVRGRQAQAGVRSAATRRTTHGIEQHHKAIQLSASGHSTRQVAAVLGIDQSTVSRWLRAG